VEAYSNLGIVLVGKDDLKAAIDVYTDGLKIDPENLKFKRALGSALLKIGEHERGLRFQIAGSGVIRFDIKSGVTINLGEGV
jgi:hypothetical protein